ncbi:MAG TPA: hypothetical protein VFY84_12610 [Jiangellales bacterium]|nr:hypothetical protein [Jiangellales bacterium]
MKVRFGAGLVDEHREILAHWVREHGIDPNDVPIDTEFYIDRGRLTVDVVVRDVHGEVRIDPDTPNRVLLTKRTVPLRTPMPRLGWPL